MSQPGRALSLFISRVQLASELTRKLDAQGKYEDNPAGYRPAISQQHISITGSPAATWASGGHSTSGCPSRYHG